MAMSGCYRGCDNGIVVVNERGPNHYSSASELCPCRSGLPPRQGEARWWTEEVVHQTHIESTCGLATMTVVVRPERPVSESNFPLVRRGNRYYPTTIEVDLEGGFLMAEDVRRMGEALLRAAEAAERIDAADSDPCGHWSPCRCGLARDAA